MSYPASPPGEQPSDQQYSVPTASTGGAYPPPNPEPAPTAEYGQPAFGQPVPQPGFDQAAYAPPGAQAVGPPAQPVSPAYGPPAQPVSPAYGPPAQPVSPAYGPPAQPVSPAFGPPAQPVSPAYSVNVPTQQVPAHDQAAAFAPGTAQLPVYGEPT